MAAPPRKIFVLDDDAHELNELINKLTDNRFIVSVFSSPVQILEQIRHELPQLIIAAGEFADMSTFELAEKAYDQRSIPSYLILQSPGDQTQLRLRRHPGIIGMYYKPIKVERLFDKVQKFFRALST